MHTPQITSTTKNLIFDLGGVIINLSYELTYEAFSRLSGLSKIEIKELVSNNSVFLDFEIGSIKSDAFRESVRKILYLNCTDSEIDKAWNAMLLDIPVQRLNTLRTLKNSYRLFLLSNTNEIHMQAFNKYLFECRDSKNLNEFFEKVYFSHEVGMRKPGAHIYSFVLEQNSLLATNTLFFDDTESNLLGAQAVGINTFHVTNADELFEELDTIK